MQIMEIIFWVKTRLSIQLMLPPQFHLQLVLKVWFTKSVMFFPELPQDLYDKYLTYVRDGAASI